MPEVAQYLPVATRTVPHLFNSGRQLAKRVGRGHPHRTFSAHGDACYSTADFEGNRGPSQISQYRMGCWILILGETPEAACIGIQHH